MPSDTPASKRPNFLVILADDLGYSDIGCFGSEIQTPNIDRLAREGLKFSDFHTAAFCSPTRSMIMSGTDCHLAGMGVMYEQRGSDPERFNRPGHEGYMNHDVATVAEVLQDAGYHTLMSGKWHLGYKDGHIPAHRGFDRSWALLPGCSNHFGWEPVWENGEAGRPRLPGHLPMLYVDDDKRYMPTANTTSDPQKGFYSSTFYTSNLLNYLNDWQDSNSSPADSSESSERKPFFAYLPFAAPHWPLQCPPEDRDKYRGIYNDGPDSLRLKRLEGLKKAGLVDPNVKPHDVIAKTPEWDSMTAEEQKMSSRAMEVYAGMVDRIDQEIGRVVDWLEEKGELDNTVVMFMSDNGAEGAAMEANPTMGPRLLAGIDKWYDNSYENLGNYNSFIWYGPRWAQAATAPNRLYKGFSTEGGIRVPFVIRYPGFTSSPVKPGSIVPAFSTCMDIMPTLLSLAGARHPNSNPATPRSKVPYRDSEVYPMRGKSWVPYLVNGQYPNGTSNGDSTEAFYGGDTAVGWEMHAKCSLRKGKWKIVNMPVNAHGSGGWQLYNLQTDQGETTDLANQYPEILDELVKEWGSYVEETGTVFGPPMKDGKMFPLPPDMIGGDPVEDMRGWMRVGKGKRLGEITEPRPDVEAWGGFKADNDAGLTKKVPAAA